MILIQKQNLLNLNFQLISVAYNTNMENKFSIYKLKKLEIKTKSIPSQLQFKLFQMNFKKNTTTNFKNKKPNNLNECTIKTKTTILILNNQVLKERKILEITNKNYKTKKKACIIFQKSQFEINNEKNSIKIITKLSEKMFNKKMNNIKIEKESKKRNNKVIYKLMSKFKILNSKNKEKFNKLIPEFSNKKLLIPSNLIWNCKNNFVSNNSNKLNFSTKNNNEKSNFNNNLYWYGYPKNKDSWNDSIKESSTTLSSLTRRYIIVGERYFSNYCWTFLISLGAGGFFLTGISSYLGYNIIPFFNSELVPFFPQGLLMAFYGSLGLLLSIYWWFLIYWNIGSGFNEFNKKDGFIRVFRWGYPGKNRRIDLLYSLKDVEAIKVDVKQGLDAQRTIYVRLKGKREIPLTGIGEPLTLKDLEKQASELASFLQVSLEGL